MRDARETREVIEKWAMECRDYIRRGQAISALASLLLAFEALEEYVLPDENGKRPHPAR